MSFPSSFGTQVAAIMNVLAKAAVAEITQLAEEGGVLLRLELRRRDGEIQELRRSLEVMEAELCKAQEAAAARLTEETQELAAAAGTQVQWGDVKARQEMCAVYCEPGPADSLCEPQTGTDESHDIRPVVKQEPDIELPASETTANTATAAVGSDAGEHEDSVWPSPACSVVEKSSALMQQPIQTFPFHAEQFSSCRNSEISFSPLLAATKEVADDCSTVPVKLEVNMNPARTESSPSQSVHAKQFGHDSHAAVVQDESLQCASQQAGLSVALSHGQRSTAGTSGSHSEDHFNNRNSLRTKRILNVWRTNQKLFMCCVCNKSFARLSQLEEHNKNTHQTMKPFRCLECGKSFTQKTRLKTHQSVHTGERPFSCKICGKMFSRQDNCLRHERFHSGLKPYGCKQCGKSFTVMGNLKIHLEIHRQGR
ncbi:zinc finger protein 568-like [Cololabis saira]|uniref:zinc finger protein 568-like n=1 Tax=Cololabis saira TaxID=129043 RepID=UPI002AD1F6F4|nr:zinc finger protein 568-like [Cololabis saira]